METYLGHQDGRFANLMARVLQVGDFLVHAVNDLEVSLFLALVQALKVGWLRLSLC